MKPLKIAALGLAAVLAVASLGLAFGVPAGFLTKRVQDQIESRTGYRLRIDGDTKLAFRPSPTVTLTRISLLDANGSNAATGFAAESVRVSLSLASLFSGRPGITEVAIVKPVLRAPLLRQRESRGGGRIHAVATTNAAAATPAVTVDRLIVEDGTVVMSNARDRVEMRIDRIGLTASLTADEGRLEAHAYAGDQPIRLQASAKSPVAGFEGANVPVDFSFEAPGFLDGTLTGTSDVRFAGSILRINGLTGKIGASKLNGWASLDFSSKLLVKGDFDVQRLAVMVPPPAAASGRRGRRAIAGEPAMEHPDGPPRRPELCGRRRAVLRRRVERRHLPLRADRHAYHARRRAPHCRTVAQRLVWRTGGRHRVGRCLQRHSDARIPHRPHRCARLAAPLRCRGFRGARRAAPGEDSMFGRPARANAR